MINFQDRRVRRRYEKDDSLLLRKIKADNHIHTILIDEIQKVPELFDLQYILSTLIDLVCYTQHFFILTKKGANIAKDN